MSPENVPSVPNDERPVVVIVDWNITTTSPIGSSVLEILRALHDDYRFVVVAAYFENPNPAKIEHVEVRLPPTPSFVKELCWPTLVRLAFRRPPLRDLPTHVTRATQGQLVGAEIVSAHFCHRAYLDRYFSRSGTRGLRRVSRFLVHWYSTRLERAAFARARLITVPSRGLEREIAETYPFAADKLLVVPNPVDTEKFAPDPDFDPAEVRRRLGIGPDEFVFSFVALGDFGRKGLDVALRSLALIGPSAARIVVVGGTESEICVYRDLAKRLGVAESLNFVGLQIDIRPYLWLADAFVFPTIYETGSKAVLQAAAAGLPVITTRIHGIEDMIEDGVNGWFAERDEHAFAGVMKKALTDRTALREMGRRARTSAATYDRRFYSERWDDILSWASSGEASLRPLTTRHAPVDGPLQERERLDSETLAASS